jgi:hypothetical protein
MAALLFPVLLGVYLLITSTTHLSDTLWQYDAKRMLQLYLLPCLFLWVLLVPTLRTAFNEQLARIPRWMGIALTAMFALGVVSAWHNSESTMGLAYSLADVALLFLLITAALAIAACRSISGEIFDRILIILIAMVGVTVGLQELIGILAAWNTGLEFNFESSLVYFAFPRFFNQIQSWTIPAIAAVPLLFPRNRLALMFCLLALSLNWFVVIETGGRGTALGVITALIFVAVLSPVARKKLLPLQLVGLLVGLLIFGSIALIHEQRGDVIVEQPTNSDSIGNDVPKGKELSLNSGDGSFVGAVTGKRIATSSGRTWMWRGSWKDAMNNPLLGIGPMNYACKGPKFRAAHPHNFPLQFLSEWGFPAFALLIIIGGYMAFSLVAALRGRSHIQGHNPDLQIALGTALVAAAVHSCFSGVLIMPASQSAGILITGWFLGTYTSTKIASDSKVLGILVLSFTLLVSTSFLWFGSQQVKENVARYEALESPGRLLPRFWQYGKDCRTEVR